MLAMGLARSHRRWRSVPAAMPSFTGWPPEALEFLRELEANNEREWFKANRPRYDELLIGPAKALAADLQDLGSTRLFRPYNDTRFHQRPPIKENVGIPIGHGGAGGWYVDLSLDGLLLAAGLYDPARDQVSRLRAGIDDGRKAAALTRALDVAERAGLSLNAPDLARGPQGVPSDHPRLDLLRRRGALPSPASTRSSRGCTARMPARTYGPPSRQRRRSSSGCALMSAPRRRRGSARAKGGRLELQVAGT